MYSQSTPNTANVRRGDATFDATILDVGWDATAGQRVADRLSTILTGHVDLEIWSFVGPHGPFEVPGAAGYFIPNAPYRIEDMAGLAGPTYTPKHALAHDPVLLVADIDYDCLADGSKPKVALAEQVRRVVASGLPAPTWAVFSGGKSIHFVWVGMGTVKEFERAADLIARKLGADPAMRQRAQLTRLPGAEWTSPDRQTKRRQPVLFLNETQTQPYSFKDLADILEPLPDYLLGPYFATKATKTGNGTKSGKSKALPLDPEQMIPGHGVTARQLAASIGEGNKTSICCPFHADATPSAVLFAGENEVVSIFCSSCTTTWRSGAPGVYKAGHASGFPAKKKGKKSASPFRRVDARYDRRLGAYTIDGTIYLRAPKESGKTHETIDGAKRHLAKEKKDILWTVHRRSLVAQTVARLKLAGVPVQDYREINGLIVPDPENPRVIVICLDSIGRVKGWTAKGTETIGGVTRLGHPVRWGAVIIDEAEQVWRHLVGSTIGTDYDAIYDRLAILIRNADARVFIDADLGNLTLNIVRGMQGLPADMTMPSDTLIVSHAHPKRSANVHTSAASLDIMLRGSQGFGGTGRIAVHCSGRKEAQRIAGMARKGGRNPLLVCSRTTGEPEVVEFLRDPNGWLDANPTRDLIYSPSMGTGVSIDGDKFHRVFAYLSPQSGPGVYDHLQAIDRVRSPVDPVRQVWIGDEELSLPTDPKRIGETALTRADIEARSIGASAIPGTRHYERGTGDDKSLVAVPHNPEAFEAWTEIVAVRNAARNTQRADMLRLMADAHWTVTHEVAPGVAAEMAATIEAVATRREIRDAEIASVLTAPADMTANDAEEILHGDKAATEADRDRALRAELRDMAPGVVPAKRQVMAHLKGKLRTMIARYAVVRAVMEKDQRSLELLKSASFIDLGGTGARQPVAVGRLLAALLSPKATEPAIRMIARRLRTLGVHLGNPDTAPVKDIIGRAWSEIGIDRVRRQTRHTTSGSVSKKKDRSGVTATYELNPDTQAWMEGAADAWLARTQARLAAHDVPTLPGRIPQPPRLGALDTSAFDTLVARTLDDVADAGTLAAA